MLRGRSFGSLTVSLIETKKHIVLLGDVCFQSAKLENSTDAGGNFNTSHLITFILKSNLTNI